MRVLRVILIPLVALATLIGLAGLSPAKAPAVELPSHTVKTKLSETASKELTTATVLAKHGLYAKHLSIWEMKNYAAKNHHFHDTTVAYQMAAGYYFAGGKVTGGNSSDWKKIRALLPKGKPANASAARGIGRVSTHAPKGCQGSNKWRFEYKYSYKGVDSCRVNDTLFNDAKVGTAFGIIAAVCAITGVGVPVAAVAGAAAALVGLHAGWVSWCANKSTIGAFWIRFPSWQPFWTFPRSFTVTCIPQ